MDALIKEIAEKYDIRASLLEKAFEQQFKFIYEIAKTIDPHDENTWEKVVFLRSLGKFIPDKRVMSNVTNRYKKYAKVRELANNGGEYHKWLEKLHNKRKSNRSGGNEESGNMLEVPSC